MAAMRAKWRGLSAAVLAVLMCACSDAATRVAYDIESGVKQLGSQEGSRTEIPHVPSRWPEGCAGSYRLRIGKGSATAEGNNNFHINPGAAGLSIRCYGSNGNPHAWSTTYHLRFVDVPQTVEVEKPDGGTAFIQVDRQGGRAVVVGLR